MKNKSGIALILGSVAVLAMGCASTGDGMKQVPTLIVTTPVVTLAPGGQVTMYGTGFTPKQEVTILFADPGGGMSGLSSAVTPAPIPNKEGAWAATWNFAPYLKMLTPGTGMLSVVDKDYKTLSHAPVVFVAPPAKPKPEAAKPEAKPEAGKPGAKPPAR